MDNRGFKARLIGAIAIALIAFFMYTLQTQVNPVTGERQHISISTDQEKRLGLESAPQMAREMGGELSSSDPRTQEVQKMGERIAAHTYASKSPWKFQFHLLADDETINAFALPGGQIFITLGLYNKLKTEAQLAGVLSHEVGHVIERHTAQQMAKSQLGQMLVMATGVGASDASQNMNQQAVMIASLINQMFQLRFSREDESEADLWAIRLMLQLDYDPRAMIEVMKILKAAGGGGHVPEFFQTHPNPDLRIKQIEEYLATHPVPEHLNEGGALKESYLYQ